MKKIYTIICVFILLASSIYSQEPLITMVTSKSIGSTVQFYIKAVADSTPIQIDFGDGIPVEKFVGTTKSLVSGTIMGSNNIVITGAGIDEFNCNGNELTQLDVTAYEGLTYLACHTNQLSDIDLSNQAFLEILSCQTNKFAAINLSGCNKLTYLTCYANQLEFLNLQENRLLDYLICNSNQISDLDLSNNTLLRYIDCSNNKLVTLDVTKNTALESLNCPSNKLTNLVIIDTHRYSSINCANNNLTFSTLPIDNTGWDAYNYAPQNKLEIQKTTEIGEMISFMRPFSTDIHTSAETWKTTGGKTLVPETDYRYESAGKLVFLASQSDSVYCEMTDTLFPDFTEENVLKTTNLWIVPEVESSIEPTVYDKINLKVENNLFTVEVNETILLTIVDLNGRVQLTKTLVEGTNSLTFEGKGIFIVKATGKNGTLTKKILVD